MDSNEAAPGRSIFSVTRRSAFTLVEILVALAILAALTAVVIPTVEGAIERSRITRMASDLLAISPDKPRATEYCTIRYLILVPRPSLIWLSLSTPP